VLELTSGRSSGGGALPPNRMLEVERAVLRAIGVPVPLEPE
jgi:hypothetical protein